MRNLKRVLALALALVMILGMMVIGSSAASYTDAAAIDGKYAEAVEVLTGMGIFKGQDANNFAPKAQLTRAEASALIYRVITGDVTDSKIALYDYASFADTVEGAWSTGYITYAANGGYVKGDGTGNFNPTDYVTGVQVLAIMLRAIGYGQNGEYEGAAWKDNVLTDAYDLYITEGVAANDLDKPATREMVAQLIWNAISGPNMVTYLANTKSYIPVTISNLAGMSQTSLGELVFGLTKLGHYVIGNQATGEKATKVLGDLSIEGADRGKLSVDLTYTSGLELFGHYVTGWYSVGGRGAAAGDVFYLVDNGTSATVTAAEYAQLLDTAEFFSASYGDIESTGFVADYNVLVNNPATKQDVLVALDLDIAQYVAINKYITNPYLVVKSGAAKGDVAISLAKATGYENIALGSYVNVLTITGTHNASNKVFPQKQISVLGAHANVSVKYVAKNGAITLSDGTVLKSSSTTHKGYAANVNAALAVPQVWDFGANYVIYTDLFGNYVAARELSNTFFAKITYAYYITDPAAGEHTYYAQIVKIDGTTETVKLAVTAAGYEALTCNKLTWSGNSVTANSYMDVILVPAQGGAYAIAHSEIDTDCGNLANVVAKDGLTTLGALRNNNNAWSVKKYYTTIGGAGNNNYFVDTNTKIVLVTGFGSKLTIKTFNGLADLIGSNSGAYIPADAIVSASQVYTANVGSQNYHVDYILIETVGYNLYQNLVYVADATVLGTSAAGSTINAYFEGVEKQIVVSGKSVALENNKFYEYTLTGDVYTLVEVKYSDVIENYTLTVVEGTAYLQINDANGKYYAITENAVIVNLTNAKNVPTTAADLMIAAENNLVKVDAEISDYDVAVVYIYEYTQA